MLKRWDLRLAMPVEPNISFDGSFAGPAGVVHVAPHSEGTCHEAVCNCFTSQAPHVFRLTWCASTVGKAGIGCSMDVGYRSQEGPTRGRMGVSVDGLNASEASFVWLDAAAVWAAAAIRQTR